MLMSAQSEKTDNVFTRLGAAESASRRHGQGGHGMYPSGHNRVPIARTMFCRRAGERIGLSKGPIAFLGGVFWPGNALAYINPI